MILRSFSLRTSEFISEQGLEAKPRALCLGMCFVSSTHAEKVNGKQDSGARDRARLVQLNQKFEVYSASRLESASESDLEPGRHFNVSYGSRAAKDIHKAHSGAAFEWVLLDYVRFPLGSV
jgi:hypothetical protein